MQNQNGIGIGKGIGEENKESAIAPKKKFSLPSLEERQKSFAETIRPYVEQYGETMCKKSLILYIHYNRVKNIKLLRYFKKMRFQDFAFEYHGCNLSLILRQRKSRDELVPTSIF